MTFWALEQPPGQCAASDEAGQRSLDYAQLGAGADAFARRVAAESRRTLGFILCRNDLATLEAYLGCLRSRQVGCLLPASLDASLLGELSRRYRPDWIFASRGTDCGADYELAAEEGRTSLHARRERDTTPLHDDLALLLPTSGSTGSAKLARLSQRNLQSNAESIAEYLALDSSERPITSLPMHYSYGLSVVNSHLLAGATLLVTGRSVMEAEFWKFFATERATSIAGVPFVHQMLLRLRLLERDLPSLRTITQAGGRMPREGLEALDAIARQRHWRFFPMYGQTEASPRISYVPLERLPEKLHSIGIAIPRGRLDVDPASGELVYSGPNVMLGYATRRSDLALGDVLGGTLRTGDLGRRDDDGFFHVEGRLRRFLKVAGSRLNLDDLEETLQLRLGVPVACTGEDDRLIVIVEGSDACAPARTLLRELFQVRVGLARVESVAALPRMSSGKIDYGELNRCATS